MFSSTPFYSYIETQYTRTRTFTCLSIEDGFLVTSVVTKLDGWFWQLRPKT